MKAPATRWMKVPMSLLSSVSPPPEVSASYLVSQVRTLRVLSLCEISIQVTPVQAPTGRIRWFSVWPFHHQQQLQGILHNCGSSVGPRSASETSFVSSPLERDSSPQAGS